MFQLEPPPQIERATVSSRKAPFWSRSATSFPGRSPCYQRGRVKIVDSKTFKVSKTIAATLVEVEPGGMRELHWHPNTDEWQYYLSGEAKMTVFAAEGRARTFNYQAGDVGYVPLQWDIMFRIPVTPYFAFWKFSKATVSKTSP